MERLDRENTGVLIIDMQEKLMTTVEREVETTLNACKLVNGAKILGLPIIASEQYPKGLGKTVPAIANILQKPAIEKTSFSCLDNMAIQEALKLPNWIIAGVEAHICVLQTARDLLKSGKHPVVLNDAISSRSIFDYSTAIAEMRDLGIRISSVETVLFELLKDSSNPNFTHISSLIKCSANNCSCA